MHPRVLIVGTVPYNKKSTSRAFEAYFCHWEKENLAQIFSNTKAPCKGHCGTLYQITDQRILKRWISPKVQTGKIFNYEDLQQEWTDNDLEVGSNTANRLYRMGSKRTPLTHWLRGILWRKKFWCTRELQEWMDAFRPECVFLSFSDDFFIPEIALYAAQRYGIPIVSSIGDDYYFNTRFSVSPIYHLYKTAYRKLIRKVLSHPGSAIYISDKIRDKYNQEFALDGETVYLTSTVKRKEFRPIDVAAPYITYFGNIGAGRNESLNEIGMALGRINSEYTLHVYSNEQDEAVYGIFKNNPNIHFGGSIPYSEVQEKMNLSDVVVIVEGFRPENVNLTRYSLSTKAADSLASGAAILTYGSPECGIIEYMQSTDASAVCTNKEQLESCIRNLFENRKQQKHYYDRQILMTQQNHNLDSSSAVFEEVVRRAINKVEKKHA